MYKSGKHLLFATAVCIAAAMAGCGGSSSSSGNTASVPPGTDVPAVPPASNEIVISGVAATGAPLVNAAVAIFDRNGNTVGSGRTDSTGFFKIGVDLLSAGPLAVQATRGNSIGGNDTLVALTDTKTSTTVNVNQISNLVAALTLVSGNPSTVAADLASGKVTFDETVLAANWNKLGAITEPLLNAVKTSIDTVRSGPAPAIGTGPDRLLDLIDILITKNNDGTSTIEMTIKAASNGMQMPVIRFTNSKSLAAILEDNAITKTAVRQQLITEDILPPVGTSAQIADLLKRMSACFSLPTSSRVSYIDDTNAVVKAQECKSLFKNDNPDDYLHFGEAVSKNGAFSTLFSDNGTGTDFRQGTFEFKQDNGDIVFSMVTVDKNQVSRYEESVANLAPDGRLRLTGNQYKFAGSINPMAELHYFFDGSDSPYISTGYNITVPLQSTKEKEVREVSQVKVTSPVGTTYTLVRGTEAMALPILNESFTPEYDDNGKLSPSGSAYLRLSAKEWQILEFDNIAKRKDMPYVPERNLYLQKQSVLDEAIAVYPPRGAWTFDYFTNGDSTLLARQIVRTRARALTQSEIEASGQLNPLTAFVLDQDSLKALRSRQDPQTNPATTLIFPLGGVTSLSYGWTQYGQGTAPALPPIFTRIYGFLYDSFSIPTARDFSESVDLRPETRTATLPCSIRVGVPHCNLSRAFLGNAWLDGVQLLSRDGLGREFSTFASTWRFPQ